MKCVFITFLLFSVATSAFAKQDIDVIKRSIVKINSYLPVVVEIRSEPGMFTGTGFIADLERNLVVTNRHVAPVDSGDVRIEFYNGIQAAAEIVYVDPVLDISILKFHRDDSTPKNIASLKFPRQNENSIKNGQKVLLAGHDEGTSFSIIEGKIINNNITSGLSNGLSFQTKIRSEGGSSGSPILNESNEVIGLHFAGTKSTSFEISFKHIKDILRKVKEPSPKTFYYGGIETQTISLNDTLRLFPKYKNIILTHLNIKDVKDLNETVNLINISNIAKFSDLKNKASEGDVVLEVNGIKIINPYTLFNELSNNEYIDIKVLSNNGIKEFKKLRQLPLRTKSIPFVSFSGAIFKEVDAADAENFNIKVFDGKVLCSFASHNSPFFDKASRVTDVGQYGFVIKRINQVEIKSLTHFYDVVKQLKNNSRITLTIEDLNNNSVVSNHEIYVNTFLFNTAYQGKEIELNITKLKTKELPEA